ncbi:hypothetical protein JCM19231_1834 [Vibrio ishigakensis]|uniref:REDY-like protein HapK n=1 Tax=Vibrio ishigakensis TaxID=1481914 RepID=A0A0B8P7N7_9VIBR|nr:hypothetical protein [Vibrio ishigakensis]GAM59258.1 hypothetical protein JCM19231_1834 [Vibrio ishigakensis]
MQNPARTLMVFFNLKPETQESDYLNWAKQIDLPTVNQLKSVSSFEVFKGLSLLGQETASPWQYFEVIQIESEAAFLEDIQSPEMQKVIEQFQAFTQDAHFVSTQNILSN